MHVDFEREEEFIFIFTTPNKKTRNKIAYSSPITAEKHIKDLAQTYNVKMPYE